ncbi:primase [Vairimorpha necatrix]|uniref:Primase n=1 Tax=Vairimorpha necatrix TaxID=6039 RepID=A0AAX4JFA5_9MICR
MLPCEIKKNKYTGNETKKEIILTICKSILKSEGLSFSVMEQPILNDYGYIINYVGDCPTKKVPHKRNRCVITITDSRISLGCYDEECKGVINIKIDVIPIVIRNFIFGDGGTILKTNKGAHFGGFNEDDTLQTRASQFLINKYKDRFESEADIEHYLKGWNFFLLSEKDNKKVIVEEFASQQFVYCALKKQKNIVECENTGLVINTETKNMIALKSVVELESQKNLYSAEDFDIFKSIINMPISRNIVNLFLRTNLSREFKYYNLVLYRRENDLWVPTNERTLREEILISISDFFNPFSIWSGIRFIKEMESSTNISQIVCASGGILRDYTFGDKLDADFSLIPFKTKVYSLDTKELRDYSPDDYFTKKFPMDHNINSDVNIALRFLRSCGSNGKSLLIHLLSAIFGDFGQALPSAFFSMESNNSSIANPLLKGLKTKKVAFLSEPQAGKLKSEFIKKLCGADEVSARNLFSNDIANFKLTTKFVIAMNELPSFSSVDQALWRRIRIIPLKTKFVEDPENRNEKK